MTDARSADLKLPEEIDKGISGGMDLLRTIYELTQKLLDDQRRQQETNHELLKRIAAVENEQRRTRQAAVESDDADDWELAYDRLGHRLTRIDEIVEDNGAELNLMRGKLDVILDLLQRRA